jgi:hypothetical protein
MKAQDGMATTNIRLPKTHLKALKRVAVERECSLSRLVREILEEFLERQRRPLSPAAFGNDPLFGLGTKPGRSGLADLAEHHNKYLYGRKG